jgi:hypothetical protein
MRQKLSNSGGKIATNSYGVTLSQKVEVIGRQKSEEEKLKLKI